MKIVSLELAKQLKKAGYPITTQFHYRYPVDDLGKKSGEVFIEYNNPDNPSCFDAGHDHEPVPAPTADEILDRLPKERYYTCVKTNTDRWRVAEFGENGLAEEGKTSFIAESIADAAAKMWLYLKENDLLDVKR